MKRSHSPLACVIFMTSLVAIMVEAAMDQGTKDYILKLHNDYRRKQGASDMAKLVWDERMEDEADSWAANCDFKHKGMGENLAWNSQVDKPQTELIDTAMENFYNEIKLYSYGQNSCGSPRQACHYTQMVWAKTLKVGCATRVCQPLRGAYSKAWYLVCRYDPVGNWNGEKPFQKGQACSACSGKTCDNGLCVGAGTEDGQGGQGSTSAPKEDCKDDNNGCPGWASRGQCTINPSYMKTNCKKSCKICDSGSGNMNPDNTNSQDCKDSDTKCPMWSGWGEYTRNPSYMNKNCKKSCGKCPGGTGNTPTPPRTACTDSNVSCPSWAKRGECYRNRYYMLKKCRKSCKQC